MTEHTFTGIANATGIIDRGGDVLAPGAFQDALPAFLSRFITFGHDWDRLPVAMPIAASETPEGLRVTGRFHSTREGEAARTVVQERLDQGLEVGLSIGYRTKPSDCVGFRSGVDLLAYAARNGLTGLDEAGIRDWQTPCRLVRRVAELFEVSIVSVPLNPESRVQEAKSPVCLRVEQQGIVLRLNRARLEVQ